MQGKYIINCEAHQLLTVLMGFIFVQVLHHPLSAQSNFKNDLVFDDTVVPRIDIEINRDSFYDLLLPGNLEKDHEYPANFIWDNGVKKDTVRNVGFRLTSILLFLQQVLQLILQ